MSQFKNLVPAFFTACSALVVTSATAAADPVVDEMPTIPGNQGYIIAVHNPPRADAAQGRDARGFIYVMEGSVVMQLQGGKKVTLQAGQTLYDAPKDLRVVGRNASGIEPAEYLVVLRREAGAPAVVGAEASFSDSLTGQSDYSVFFQPEVSEGLRRAALRKLFRNPSYNVSDGLEVYAGDRRTYTPLGDTVTADMRMAPERAAEQTAAANAPGTAQTATIYAGLPPVISRAAEAR